MAMQGLPRKLVANGSNSGPFPSFPHSHSTEKPSFLGWFPLAVRSGVIPGLLFPLHLPALRVFPVKLSTCFNPTSRIRNKPEGSPKLRWF